MIFMEVSVSLQDIATNASTPQHRAYLQAKMPSHIEMLRDEYSFMLYGQDVSELPHPARCGLTRIPTMPETCLPLLPGLRCF